jgi:hypothetical protein
MVEPVSVLFGGIAVEMGGMLTVEAIDPEGNRIKFGRPL